MEEINQNRESLQETTRRGWGSRPFGWDVRKRERGDVEGFSWEAEGRTTRRERPNQRK